MRPILFFLPFDGPPVYAYGTMLYLSFACGWLLSLRLAAKEGLSRPLTQTCFLVTGVSALVGARLLFVLTNPDMMRGPADVVDLASGGLVAYGGFLGGLLGSVLFCRVARVPILVWADCAIPSLCAGLALTRVGCLLAGCDFGAPWDGAWAIRFPPGSPAFQHQAVEGLIAPYALSSLPVHPTQIYESLAGVGLLLAVFAARRAWRVPGIGLAVFGLGYAVLRFVIEAFRADPQRGALGPLSTSQLIALISGVAALLFAVWLRRRGLSGLTRPRARAASA